jgi:hypothetical protein
MPTSATINTSFVERHNLTQRQSNRRFTRRTNGFSKDLAWFERQLWLSLAYYHLAQKHSGIESPSGDWPHRIVGHPLCIGPVAHTCRISLQRHHS